MSDNGYRGEGWFWKPVSLFLIGILFSGTTFFIKESLSEKGFITRDEIRDLIKVESPYSSDRKLILTSLNNINNQLDNIDKDLDYIKENFWRRIEKINGLTVK